ncbi:MAG TPA: PEP-CTERM sorting domain-containing protein [Burkholderiaceae bacterium]|nr:PEP-CTERM sorting domain-containing protein [Burkholderiaceae bacterium]
MARVLARLAVVAGLSLLAGSVQADPLPNLTNLNFLTYTGAAPKNYFNTVDPTGWTGGTGLIFIDAPGTSNTDPTTACGPTYLTTYGCPSTLAIPGGYNFVEADGNPSFESGFNYLVTGLTPGQSYTLSFYEAGSQQTGFGNGLNTTEQWIVSLGTAGMTFCNGCGAPDAYYGGNDSTYSNADPTASVVATPIMTTPSGGMTDWQYVSITLTADATTDLLSFLAWGDNGNTVNLPPIVFLAGVNSPAGLNNVPEPATLALLGAGFISVTAIRLRRRSKQPSAS